MFLLNNRKITIDTQITVNGVTYPNLRDPMLRGMLGVEEVPDPVRPTPEENYYITENEDGSLNITEKSPEQIKEQENAKVLAQIDSTERNSMFPRVLREFLLEQPGAAQKPWFAKVKAVDDEVAAMRGKLK